MVGSATVLAAFLAAQDPPPTAPPKGTETVERVVAAARELRAAMSGQQDEAAERRRSEARAALQAAVAELEAAPAGVAADEWARTIRAAWSVGCAGETATLCGLALAQGLDSPELWCQLGMSRLAQAQEEELPAVQRRLGDASAAAFVKARAGAAPLPAYLFLSQAWAVACDFEAALADFDRVRADERVAAQVIAAVKSIGSYRATLLLCAGRFAEAAGTFAALPETERGRHNDLLLARSQVLAGRTDDAIATARRLFADRPNDAHQTLLVDVLGYAGRVGEALAVLAERAPSTNGMDETELAQLKKSRAVLEYLVRLDGKRPLDLRQQLAQRLEHRFVVMGAESLTGQVAKQQEQLTTSPLALGMLLQQVAGNTSSWANDLLMCICVADAAGYEPGALERTVLDIVLRDEARAAIVGEHAARDARRALAGHRMMPNAEGILCAERLLGAAGPGQGR
jgi:hypothetical protein